MSQLTNSSKEPNQSPVRSSRNNISKRTKGRYLPQGVLTAFFLFFLFIPITPQIAGYDGPEPTGHLDRRGLGTSFGLAGEEKRSDGTVRI